MTIEPLAGITEVEAVLTGENDALLDAASAGIRSYCGWHISPVLTSTELVQSGNGTVVLKTLKLVSVTEITTAPIGADPEVQDISQIRVRGNVLHGLGPGWYHVTYTHGYETLPADLMAVLASAVSGGRNANGILRQVGAVSYEIGDWTNSAIGATPNDRRVMDRYRIGPRP